MWTVPTPEERQRILDKIVAGLDQQPPSDDDSAEAAYDRMVHALARKAARQAVGGAR